MKAKEHFKINDIKSIQFGILSIILSLLLRKTYLRKQSINQINSTELEKEIETNIELTKKHINTQKKVIERFENLKMKKIKSIILNTSDKNKTRKRIYQKNFIQVPINIILLTISFILIHFLLSPIIRQTETQNKFIGKIYGNKIYFTIYSSISVLYIIAFFIYHKFFVE